MENPLVSIIVPIYNVQEYIEKCIRSLFEQSYKTIEYIFIDDCGQDQSLRVLNTLVNEYPERKHHVKVLKHQENKGLPAARNTGMGETLGKYIYHCDSDDWADERLIEDLVSKAEITNADIVFCDFYNVYGEEKHIYQQHKKETYEEYLKDFFMGYSQGSVWNKLFKRSLFNENQIKFPEGLPMLEDLRTIVQLYYFADKIEYLPRPLYYYIKSRASSISGVEYQKSTKLSIDRIENVKGIQSFLTEKKITNVDLELSLLKLGAKQNLLINATTITTLKEWRGIFPEANKYVKKSHLPSYYKIIVYCILKDLWLLPRLWLIMKSFKKNN
ncbi:glycosyltransferase family 2 protein [Elizabethkingia anophelis]|uniref:glycosyltransferase family 2 protein n=1 Tax=Elizabethkingia anophelis TaxID=1117645 RepID=UPI00099A4A61|nr:glycosyltransferase family 2 protein [Elizabethkingia anophelis]MDV2446930.1 glycosyltransferase family 2 protein [Elizabethkingia anophelis]MDV3926655.1 glycosyltransferase family 2 protein [Elizabethkingia anophelis]MDV4025677.1 glycosyltransferase family 2 protein [Elizabethkingia anophelis]OPC55397.1 hypothetical protein BAY06_00475 [Elizabethkingia anophelis]